MPRSLAAARTEPPRTIEPNTLRSSQSMRRKALLLFGWPVATTRPRGAETRVAGDVTKSNTSLNHPTLARSTTTMRPLPSALAVAVLGAVGFSGTAHADAYGASFSGCETAIQERLGLSDTPATYNIEKIRSKARYRQIDYSVT